MICEGAVSSVVERLPYKQVVIGSNPIPPKFVSKLDLRKLLERFFLSF